VPGQQVAKHPPCSLKYPPRLWVRISNAAHRKLRPDRGRVHVATSRLAAAVLTWVRSAQAGAVRPVPTIGRVKRHRSTLLGRARHRIPSTALRALYAPPCALATPAPWYDRPSPLTRVGSSGKLNLQSRTRCARCARHVNNASCTVHGARPIHGRLFKQVLTDYGASQGVGDCFLTMTEQTRCATYAKVRTAQPDRLNAQGFDGAPTCAGSIYSGGTDGTRHGPEHITSA
jgi:hypothetical protein